METNKKVEKEKLSFLNKILNKVEVIGDCELFSVNFILLWLELLN